MAEKKSITPTQPCQPLPTEKETDLLNTPKDSNRILTLNRVNLQNDGINNLQESLNAVHEFCKEDFRILSEDERRKGLLILIILFAKVATTLHTNRIRKKLLRMLASDIGEKIVNYFLEYGCGFPEVMEERLDVSHQMISLRLKTLRAAGLVKDLTIMEKTYGKKKPHNPRHRIPTLWGLFNATPKQAFAARNAYAEYRENQFKLKHLEAEAEAKRQRQAAENEFKVQAQLLKEQAKNLEDEVKILFTEYAKDKILPIKHSDFRNWMRDVKGIAWEEAKKYSVIGVKLGLVAP